MGKFDSFRACQIKVDIVRQEYKCTCDGCEKEIEKRNDENDVTLNAAKYVFCPRCFERISEFIIMRHEEAGKSTAL